MKEKYVLFFAAVLLIFGCKLQAQISLSKSSAKSNEFEIVGSKNKTAIFYDTDDALVVEKAANLLSCDIELVTSSKVSTNQSTNIKSDNGIFIGTLGNSKVIDKIVKDRKIDVSALINKWESYHIEIVKNPVPGVKKGLVIIGSDRRGTAYGTFAISKAIGVSPWYWWADAPVKKQNTLSIKIDKTLSKEPSVKYRGIFINDEDWGLLRWAKNTFEPEPKNIGSRTYAKVCELLLRLNANYLCPAMHEASTAFNQIPENKLVADSFAIVMGSVHCEPLLFNNASEWKKGTMGEWDYINNKNGINSVLKKRVEENSPFENVYTLALRGLHDKAMEGSNVMQDRVKQLEGALNDQRQIVIDVTGKRGEDIPQAFTPYKEVLDVYNAGLKLPDDVTIIWADDNYGYMKRLSGTEEQKRSGRSGVYYHVSYLGKPHDYLWIGSTPPNLMYEELKKAYDTTADRVWLLNVGDIKSCEFMADYFLSLAYDIEAFDYDRSAKYQAEWLSNVFGDKYYNEFLDITTSFYNLSFARKPEFMGWGYQWSTNKHGRERNTDTDFSLTNYQEADRRMAEYKRIGDLSEKIMNELDESKRAGFYQMLYYPVKGSDLLNRMILTGQKNRWYARQNRAVTNHLHKEVKQYYDSLDIISKGYNNLLNGKWNHIMTMKQGFAAAYFEMPKLDTISVISSPQLGIWVEQEDVLLGQKSFHSLPAFNTYTRKNYSFDIYNKGNGKLNWQLSTSANWIKTDKQEGGTLYQDKVTVSIDWDKVPKGGKVLGTIDVASGNDKRQIFVSVFNPASPLASEVNGLFIEDNGYVSIPASEYHRIVENEEIKMITIPNLGFENTSVQLGNPMAAPQNVNRSDVPRLEYDFYTFDHGSVDVYTYVLPTFPISPDRGYAGHEANNTETKYGVSIDDGPVMRPATSSLEYAQIWYESALKNCRINKTTLHINKSGKHRLNIMCGDPGVVVQKIVLDFGGMKRSYMGPQSTKSEKVE